MGIPESSNRSSDGPAKTSEAGKVSLWIHGGSLLAWVGLCLCFLLLQEHSGLRSFLCSNKSGCDTVLHSPFASVKGVPLPWAGAVFYGVLLFLWLGSCAAESQRLRARLLETILWLELVGFTFSLGLMYLQFVVLRAFCPLCTASAVTVTALLVTVFRAKQVEEAQPSGSAARSAWMLGCFALIAMSLFVSNLFGRSQTAGGIWLADLSTAHRLGPEKAAVQLIVYSDFECGFCRQLHGVLQRVEKEYPQDVAVVFRHFPLASHPRALPAAVAAECAAEQGLFWQYHDKLFAEGGDLSDARLRELAVGVGVDGRRFDACLQAGAGRKVVTENLHEAEALELPGTPYVFVNGRPLTGAPSYENLRKEIEGKLRAAGAGSIDWR